MAAKCRELSEGARKMGAVYGVLRSIVAYVRTYVNEAAGMYVHSESPINSYMHVTTVTAVTAKLKV